MHPGRRPSRRLGAATVLVSTGALLVLSATPAAADEKGCVKGVDPKTTIENITCQWNNNVEHIKDQLDTLQGKPPKEEPKPKPSPSINKGKAEEPKPKPKKPKPAPPAPPTPASSRVPLPQSAYTAPLPAPTTPDILPEPQVAEAPTTTLALPPTHIISPASATTPAGNPTQALWTAAATAAVTTLVMAHFTILGAHLRRPTPHR
ncbi:hypothetical protein LO762_13240 [Actinocorallia sp. API 0066]|uniref:hypothetical protein n=1 Tax=Actinocorallia sp. API 0066 TaxID=2896846 RepID=UPI001E35AEF8|nr:hypothetical protein [Actinocorallia sp. API 0066]MCD0450150.1 hypothetical protein [Actinocorallia sp. API 0066]